MGLCLHINDGIAFLNSKPALFRKKEHFFLFPFSPAYVWFIFEGEGWLF